MAEATDSRRSWRVPRWALVTFILAVGARLLVLLLQVRFGLFDMVLDAEDSSLYRSLAEGILSGPEFSVEPGKPTAYVTPGYPLFLSALFVVSRSAVFIASVQAALGGAAAVLLGAVAGRIQGARAAWAAGIAAALYPHLVFWSGYVLTEPLYVFLIALGLYAVTRAAIDREAHWAAFAGASFAAAALVRPVMLGFALLILAVGLAAPRYRRSVLVAGIALAFVYGPWVIRNAVTMDAFVPTSTESGYVLWQGNSPESTGGTRGYVDAVDFVRLERAEAEDEVEKDRIYGAAALAWMADHPGRVAGLVPRKLWNMWRPTYEGASRLNWLVTLASYPPLLLLAGIGLVHLVRRREVMGLVLVAFVGYHLVVHALVTGMIRFRLPVEAVLIVPAGVAVSIVLEQVRARRLVSVR